MQVPSTVAFDKSVRKAGTVVTGAQVVASGATVVVAAGATVVVAAGATVVVVAEARVIFVVTVFAGYLPDFAIFNINVHEPVEPIVNVVGLRVGVKTHEPVFDHVLTPGEFDFATTDKLLT